MSQLTVGTSALRLVPLEAPESAETSIFERLPVTSAAPFPASRLRLAVPARYEGGRRGAAPARARLSRRRRPPLRLTRRGQVVVVMLLAAVATVALFGLGLVPSQASTGATPAVNGTAGAAGARSASTLVVQSGDSLWAIATRVAPRVDPRVEVQRLIDRNRLAGASIEAGQVLVVP